MNQQIYILTSLTKTVNINQVQQLKKIVKQRTDLAITDHNWFARPSNFHQLLSAYKPPQNVLRSDQSRGPAL